MVGQGSPKASPQHLPSGHIWLSRWAIGVCLLASLASSAAADQFQLRLSWGGQIARQWQGAVWLSGGSLADPRPLGVEADEPGSMWIDGGHLLVRQRSARSYDAVDISVEAPRDAQLMIQLTAAGDHPAQRWIEAPLAEILSDGFSADLDRQGSRLRIARRPGDRLPVRLASKSMVFSQGETLVFDLDTTRLDVADGERLSFEAELVDPTAEKAMWQTEVKPVWKSKQTATLGTDTSLHWEVPLDVREGVYRLTITATGSGWLPLPEAVERPLGGKRNHASRTLELVVLSTERSTAPVGRLEDLELTELVEEIDPTRPDWWKRFANIPQPPRLRKLWKEPLGNKRSQVVDHPLGSVVRLQPNEGRADLSWEAYTIPIKAPGEPHLLDIRYPSDHPQTFGVSVVEPNDSGAAVLANLDTGVDQFEEIVTAEGSPEWRRHRVIFWPKSKTPIVLVTNRRDDDPAFYGPIRVLQIPGKLPRAYPAGGPAAQRLMAAYLDRPLFPESFSAKQVFVQPSQLGMDDWRTFHQGGTRLIDYLNHVGYGGLFLSVYADGSTIYPSRLLEPTTRYDTGAFLQTGQDPERKDVLEMLLRLCDRESIKLIPSLEFSTPLPQLEAILRGDGTDTQGMLWIGRDGRSWPEIHRSYRGRAPYYNILHPRVQEAMLEVTGELVDRYGHHPSFAGLAMQLSADGYAQLPDPSWGLDDTTIQRFEADTGTELPGTGPERFEQRFRRLAQPSGDPTWLAWRAEQLAEFYRRMQQELVGKRPDARLYLSGARMFEGEEMQRRLRPALPRQMTLRQAMLQVGVDPRQFSDPQGPMLLHAETVLPWTSLARQSVSLELESMRKAEDLAGDFGTAGALFYHQPQETSLESFDRMSPFDPSLTRLTTQAVPSGAQNRRRFVRALAQFDPLITVDGSLRVPLGQEQSLQDLMALYRSLPAARFKRLEAAGSAGPAGPLTVRYLHRDDATYFYLVNEAGFPVQARVRLQTSPGCRLEPLGGPRQAAPLRADSQGSYWDVELDAYDAAGAWLSSPTARVLGVEANWARDIDQALAARVTELNNRKSALLHPPEWAKLENPGFEAQLLDAGRIPGWMFPPGGGAVIEVDATSPRTGQAALKLVSTDRPATIVSLPFEAPRTGRLTVSMWIRSKTPEGASLPLRIGVFGVHNGRTFPRSGPLPNPIGDRWSPVLFAVDDLPREGLDELQLRVDLTGPGEVWIDDIQLWNLSFNKQEWMALVKTVYPAGETLADGQVIDCIRILESYWPRFLLQHVPAQDAAVPVVAQAPPRQTPDPTPEPPADEKPNGFMDRVRGLVPERLRF